MCCTRCGSTWVPILFGGGRRLIDVLLAQVELEVVQVIDTKEARTSTTASTANARNGSKQLGSGP